MQTASDKGGLEGERGLEERGGRLEGEKECSDQGQLDQVVPEQVVALELLGTDPLIQVTQDQSLYTDQDLTFIDLTHCSLTQLPTLNLTECHQLHLRRNKLCTLPPDLTLPHCSTLDLYDNLFTIIPSCISQAPSLCSLDLSFNRISHISRAQLPPTLQLLYAACNKIANIDEFAAANDLKVMEFGGNCLGEIPLQWHCVALEELWLASNALQFRELVLDGCPKLRILALQCNRLHGAVALRLPPSIEELWLAQNSISALYINCSGVDGKAQDHADQHSCTGCELPRLNTLDIASNAFTELPSWLPRLAPNVTDLDFKGNCIESLSSLLQTLAQMPSLCTLWMRNNPATTTASNVSRIYHSAKSDWSSKKVIIQDI